MTYASDTIVVLQRKSEANTYIKWHVASPLNSLVYLGKYNNGRVDDTGRSGGCQTQYWPDWMWVDYASPISVYSYEHHFD